jgi:hypothetical protein
MDCTQSGDEPWGAVWPDNVEKTGVSFRWRSGSPSWPPRRSRSSELEERPGHGEVGGQAVDIEIHAREILRQRHLVDEILARHTGQPLEKISRDTDRHFILTAGQAKD